MTVAPAVTATCATISPMAPAPNTHTVSPGCTLATSMTAWVPHASGSDMAPAIRVTLSGSFQTRSSAIVIYSSNAPSRFVPMPVRLPHRL